MSIKDWIRSLRRRYKVVLTTGMNGDAYGVLDRDSDRVVEGDLTEQQAQIVCAAMNRLNGEAL